MSSDEQSDKDCPLCLEAFNDDIYFYPCSCQYQICRFCWHRLRTDENGLCPGCRQPYEEHPANFQPVSLEAVQKIIAEKKQKLQNQKTKLSECRKHLSAYRVLQKNLVYVVGLSQRMADAELLKKTEFFGKFGKILKVAVGTAQNPNNTNSALPTSYTAYVTYVRTDDALRAIQAVNNLVVDGRLVKASLGTTKYCSNFLKGQSCHKQECMYLHEVADDELSFTKEDMHLGKHTECEKKLHDQISANTQSQPTQHTNANGSNSYEIKNGRDRKDSQSDSCDKPPPGFSKIDSQSSAERSSLDAQESSSKSDSACNESDCKSKPNASLAVSDEPVPSSEETQSSPVDSINQDVSETSFQTDSPICSSEIQKPSEDDRLKNSLSSSVNHMPGFSPKPKNIMTCDELERLLLNSSVPPGFAKQYTTVNNASPTQIQREAQMQSSGSFNFFLDLYDDLGFDPFSESSKALADMLEEEEKTSSSQ